MSDNEEVDDTEGIHKVDFQETNTKSVSALNQSHDIPSYDGTGESNAESTHPSPRFDRGSYESIFENIEIFDYKPVKEETACVDDVVRQKVLVKMEDDEAISSMDFVTQSTPVATLAGENSSLLNLVKKESQYGEMIDSETKCIGSIAFASSSMTSGSLPPDRNTIPSSFRGLEINCSSTQSNDDDISHPQHEIKMSPKVHYNNNIQGAQMPPLCENSITTPTLSIQFSPFLSFSEDRVTNSLMSSNHLIDVSSTKDEVTKIKVEENENDDIKYETDNQSNHLEYQPFSTTSRSSDEAFELHSSQGLTYADNLLLNASQGRIKVISTPIEKSQRTIPKVSEKKRKASNSCRSSRQPQKRFSVDLQTNEIPGGDLFVNKRDGRVRLTTNLPRKVEAIDLFTGIRTHLYASCSEASRVMGINRTRMSRTCRGGGGQIGNLIYQYIEMSGAEYEQESTRLDHSNNNVEENDPTATSSLLLL